MVRGSRRDSSGGAEADAANYAALAERLGEPEPAVATAVRSPEAERYAKLAAEYRAMGGVAYKMGLVQQAEAEQRKYASPMPSAAPATPALSSDCIASKRVVRLTLACAE